MPAKKTEKKEDWKRMRDDIEGGGRVILEPGTRKNIVIPDSHKNATAAGRALFLMQERLNLRRKGRRPPLKGIFGGGDPPPYVPPKKRE